MDAGRYLSSRETKTCPVCGKEFTVKKSHSERRRYCSKECMAVGYHEVQKGEANPNYKAAGFKNCLYCGKEFHSYNNTRIYCSLDCAVSPSRKPPKPPSIPIIPKSHPCANCGKETGSRHRKYCSVCNSQKEASKKSNKTCVVCGNSFVSHCSKTCSKECNGEWRADIQRGDKSHRWQGGRTTASLIIRGSNSYAYWRKSVFSRDGYICAVCGEKGGRLVAHHIKKFSDHPELRMKKSNGITLCKKCHTKVNGHEEEYERTFSERIEQCQNL
jgi:hypothetical protein